MEQQEKDLETITSKRGAVYHYVLSSETDKQQLH